MSKWPGIADDHGVEALAAPAEEPRLGAGDAQRGAEARATTCAAAAPTRSRAAPPPRRLRRARLEITWRVARVVALVRPEVEDPHAERRISSTCASLARVAPAALLVLARDQLGEQAERQELHADDDEQHAEREQRPVADRLAGRSSARSGRRARPMPDEREHEPQAAEEVQRPVPVAAHERDRQQVEEAAQVALHAVARAAVLAGPVVDGQLGDAEALGSARAPGCSGAARRRSADRGRPRRGTPSARSSCRAGAARTSRPVTPLKSFDGIRRVNGSRRLRLPAGDEVEALVELGEQPRDLGRIVLTVAVHRHDDVALRAWRSRPAAPRPCRSCGAAGPCGRCRRAACSRVSAANVPSVGAVVDEHDLPGRSSGSERRAELVEERAPTLAPRCGPG